VIIWDSYSIIMHTRISVLYAEVDRGKNDVCLKWKINSHIESTENWIHDKVDKSQASFQQMNYSFSNLIGPILLLRTQRFWWLKFREKLSFFGRRREPLPFGSKECYAMERLKECTQKVCITTKTNHSSFNSPEERECIS
jgi:hypothetical protein